MKKRSLKKGFTLVELVVVIAVIAVLAAVSVGAYFGITETANLQAAKTHVKQLNDMLLLSRIQQYENNKTFHEARNDMRIQGLDIVDIDEFGSYKYAWDSKKDEIVLFNMGKKGSDGEAYVVYPNEFEVPIEQKANYFLIARTVDEIRSDINFSYYLADDLEIAEDEVLKVSGGIDSGYKTFGGIEFTSSFEHEIIFHTTYFNITLSVDAPLATIIHYGFSKIIDLYDFKDGCYSENGIVGKLIVTENAKDKTISINNTSEIFYLKSKLDKTNLQGIVYNRSEELVVTCSEHMDYRLMCDFKMVYNFCEHCGSAVGVNGENNNNTDVGFLYEEEAIYFNNGTDHLITNKQTPVRLKNGQMETMVLCDHCDFGYIPYEVCEHQFEINEDGLYECVTEDGCGQKFYNPSANIKVFEDGEFYNEGNPPFTKESAPNSDKFGLDGTIGSTVSLDTMFMFSAIDGVNNKYSKAYLDGWSEYYCDYVVSLSGISYDVYEGKGDGSYPVAAEAGSLGLWGYYGPFEGIGFHSPLDMEPNVKIPLLTSVLSNPFTYEDVVNFVGTFVCGAFNCSEENKGVILKVSLCLWNPYDHTSDDIAKGAKPTWTVGTWYHTFDGTINHAH